MDLPCPPTPRIWGLSFLFFPDFLCFIVQYSRNNCNRILLCGSGTEITTAYCSAEAVPKSRLLSSINSVYLIYKNMPVLQVLLNLPFLLFGFGIKTLFFLQKGLGKTYLCGLAKGLRFCTRPEAARHKVPYKSLSGLPFPIAKAHPSAQYKSPASSITCFSCMEITFAEAEKSYPIFASCGAASIYRRHVFEQIGLLDENHFAYLEDIDLGYRALIYGYRNVFAPRARVYHAGSASSGSRYNAFKTDLSSIKSITCFSCMEITFAEAEKILLSCSMTRSSSSTKPGSTTVSLFRKITYFVSAATMPAFTALQNPVLTEKEMKLSMELGKAARERGFLVVWTPQMTLKMKKNNKKK